MQKKQIRFVGLLFSLGIFTNCTHSRLETKEPLRVFSSDLIYQPTERPQCKALLDKYCNYLYAPDNLGNLEVRRAENSIQVLQGDTSNEFSQVFYRYAIAKLKNRYLLPKDLYKALLAQGYFDKLEDFLGRRPRQEMTKNQRLASDRLTQELSYIWSMAFNETILTRMMAKYPGFHQISERLIPIELDLERRRLKRNLISEISRAIWRDDKNWKSVEYSFRRLRESYLDLIEKLDIPDEVRKDWKVRISEVQLVLPGAFPAISSEECSSTTINAYYYTYLNVLTICAGDFNSEDIVQTLAHEMGHALGIDRSQYLYETKSTFGRNLVSMRNQICSPHSFSCEDWSQYKDEYDESLASLDSFEPQLPGFQRCLKRRDTSKTISQEDYHRFANVVVADRISDFASSDRFLRITKAVVPMMNGKNQKNPNYLNPCSYYLWTQGEEPIDNELTTLLYFTAEYRCSNAAPSGRMKAAIETAKNMSVKLLSKTLEIEGEFSPNTLLESEGYSSPPYERFADVIGSYAMAELLSNLPLQWDRQNKFLASSSWQCLQPSLASHFPDESAIEKEYVFDAHTEGDQRRKELFTSPIRKVIGCDKDFEFKECSLPFKKGVM